MNAVLSLLFWLQIGHAVETAAVLCWIELSDVETSTLILPDSVDGFAKSLVWQRIDLVLLLFIFTLLTCLLARVVLPSQESGFTGRSIKGVFVPLEIGVLLWLCERLFTVPGSLFYYSLSASVAMAWFIAGRTLLTLERRLHDFMAPSRAEASIWLKLQELFSPRLSIVLFGLLALSSILLSILLSNSDETTYYGIRWGEVPSSLISSLGMVVLGVGLLREFTREKPEFISVALSCSILLYGVAHLMWIIEDSAQYLMVIAAGLKVCFLLLIASYWTLINQMKRVQDQEAEVLEQETRRWLAVARHQRDRIEFATRQHTVALDLHNYVAGRLAGARHFLDSVEACFAKGDLDSAHQQIEKVRLGLNCAEASVRSILSGLRASPIKPDELEEELEKLLEGARVLQEGLTGQLEFESHRPIPQAIADGFLNIAAEAINNIVKHAQASTISIQVLQRADETWSLTIADDGVGVKTPIPQSSASGGEGLGLMMTVARIIGYQLRLKTGAEGTILTVQAGSSSTPNPVAPRSGSDDWTH